MIRHGTWAYHGNRVVLVAAIRSWPIRYAECITEDGRWREAIALSHLEEAR